MRVSNYPLTEQKPDRELRHNRSQCTWFRVIEHRVNNYTGTALIVMAGEPF